MFLQRKWAEFKSSPAPRSGREMYVSLNPNGVLVLNRKTFETLGEPEAVVMMYDIDNAAIGLKPCTLLMPNAFVIAPRGKSGTRVIWARSFMKAHRIYVSGTYRFLRPVMEYGVLVLDLTLIARTTQSPRTGWRKTKPSAG